MAGRATSIYSASIQGRFGIGIELNPIGWVYGKTKLHPATQDSVEKKLVEISDKANNYTRVANELPEERTKRLLSTIEVVKYLLRYCKPRVLPNHPRLARFILVSTRTK